MEDIVQEGFARLAALAMASPSGIRPKAAIGTHRREPVSRPQPRCSTRPRTAESWYRLPGAPRT